MNQGGVIRYPLAARRLIVEEVGELGPHMVRVGLVGSELSGFESQSPTDHVKLLVPGPDDDEPIVPTIVDDRPFFRDERRTPMRDYTVRRFDRTQGRLDIDVVTHGHGHASRWAERAQPGDVVGVLGPRGSHILPQPDHLVLIGDLSSLPAIARWVEEVSPGTRVTTLVAVHEPGDEIELTGPGTVMSHWLHAEPPTIPADLLAARVDELDLADPSTFVWAAGEVVAMRRVRDALQMTLGAGQFGVDGYWRREHVNYDHHLPLDAD